MPSLSSKSILKVHWERFRAHVELDHKIAASMLLSYTDHPIDRLILLSEGCANTNYKVTFKTKLTPVVIRIYLRESSALAREVEVHRLLADKIPVPKIYYADSECQRYPYPYTIMEWVEGQLMRDVILSEEESAITDCAYEAGKYLNLLRKIKFPYSGFFEVDMKIRPFNKDEEYIPYVLNILQDKIVIESLGEALQTQVIELVKNNQNLLSAHQEANLTHADYDPANMIVKKINGQWKIAAILDWEFAFAGTYLLDIGMMLRYCHRLPAYYEEKFLSGIQNDGFKLPVHWKKIAKLMDLLCLLQLVHYNPLSQRPKMNLDVVSLIEDTVKRWDLF